MQKVESIADGITIHKFKNYLKFQMWLLFFLRFKQMHLFHAFFYFKVIVKKKMWFSYKWTRLILKQLIFILWNSIELMCLNKIF